MPYEVELRLGLFLGVLILVSLWQRRAPKRELKQDVKMRWGRNLSLILLDSLIVRIFLPFTAITTAVYAQQNGLGLFHHINLGEAFLLLLSIMLLDLVVYAQHVAFHYVPLFWRFHKVHHSDQEIDVTTGLRFHPLEIMISMLIKCSAVLLLGVPVLAVVLFEVILNAMAMFNHGNIALPKRLDRRLRWLLVTPDMHRVHHSVNERESNRNFGFNLAFWDKIFGTYKAQPDKGHSAMKIGLTQYQEASSVTLKELLWMPLKNTLNLPKEPS